MSNWVTIAVHVETRQRMLVDNRRRPGCVRRRSRGGGMGRLADAYAVQSPGAFLVHRARLACLWPARGGRGPSQWSRLPCHPAQESAQVNGVYRDDWQVALLPDRD